MGDFHQSTLETQQVSHCHRLENGHTKLVHAVVTATLDLDINQQNALQPVTEVVENWRAEALKTCLSSDARPCSRSSRNSRGTSMTVMTVTRPCWPRSCLVNSTTGSGLSTPVVAISTCILASYLEVSAGGMVPAMGAREWGDRSEMTAVWSGELRCKELRPRHQDRAVSNPFVSCHPTQAHQSQRCD